MEKKEISFVICILLAVFIDVLAIIDMILLLVRRKNEGSTLGLLEYLDSNVYEALLYKIGRILCLVLFLAVIVVWVMHCENQIRKTIMMIGCALIFLYVVFSLFLTVCSLMPIGVQYKLLWTVRILEALSYVLFIGAAIGFLAALVCAIIEETWKMGIFPLASILFSYFPTFPIYIIIGAVFLVIGYLVFMFFVSGGDDGGLSSPKEIFVRDKDGIFHKYKKDE